MPPPPIDVEAAEAALSRHYLGRWGGGGRQQVLCYANNNQQFVDASGTVSHQWDIPTVWKYLDGAQQKAAYDKSRDDCVASMMKVNFRSTVDDKFGRVAVNGKVISFDDIIMGYERIYQTFELFSSLQFLGVSMQQTPNDAFVIADLLWRVRPELVIELGTSGGGSAHWMMHVMQHYSDTARILTMDPAMPGAGGAGGEPLVPWNAASVKRFCPYCTPANETALWKRGRIKFVRM